ncbi:Lrp/AsnC family transcriptional regulator [Paraburkholderia sp. BCC1885]|uniref:Lrp/AsnC family transcriptional regulator n=1 Tax=Paraburkholderia sp. BCC1885 TaxID=2562669 RepID=UPI001181FAB6|nr:Lrp/AsnC family transcriptional regulator [Paraburkholderia sp. BCC1885]
MLDKTDKRLLAMLQEDGTLSVAEMAAHIPLSVTPCWRRIQRLEKEGYIRRRVALLEPSLLNLGVTVFIEIRISQHSPSWLAHFSATIQQIHEIVEVYRLSGHADYLLKALVPDISTYDGVYKQLIAGLELVDVRSSFAMETMKWSTALPLDYAM